MHELPKFTVPVTLLLAALCVILLAENVWLQRSSSVLRKQLAADTALTQASPGDSVPVLRGHTLTGQTAAYPFSGSHDTVILVFSKFCAFCDQNWPHWQQLLSSNLPLSTVLVDLSSGADQTYISSHHVDALPFIHEIDPAMIGPYKFRFTPQTILVDPTGRVKAVWSGELKGSDLNEIAALTARDATQTLTKP